MNVLLATPLYSSRHLDAGIFWLRALNRLGHAAAVWDYRLDSAPPPGQYDFTIVLKGGEVNPSFLPRPRVIYWPDALDRTPGIEQVLGQYDRVYTCLRPTPPDMTWLPTGWDPAVHRANWDSPKSHSLFIGTWTARKEQFLAVMQPTLIFGNGWERFGIPSQQAVYSHDYVREMNRAQILINIHHGPVGLNRRFFEMIACGLTISDRVPGVEEVLGPELTEALTFRTPDEGRAMLERWNSAGEIERFGAWEREYACIGPYTYENAVGRVFCA